MRDKELHRNINIDRLKLFGVVEEFGEEFVKRFLLSFINRGALCVPTRNFILIETPAVHDIIDNKEGR